MPLLINGERVAITDSATERAATGWTMEITGEATGELRLTELDQADPAGRYRLRVETDILRLQRSTGAAWASNRSYLEVGNTITVFNEGAADIDHRFESVRQANMLVIDGNLDNIAINAAVTSGDLVLIGGTRDSTNSSGTLTALRINATVAPAANASAYHLILAGTFTEAGSGTHGEFTSLRVNAPTITAGAAALTLAATLILNDAPTGATNNYMIYGSRSGTFTAMRFEDTGAPATTFDLQINAANITLGAITNDSVIFLQNNVQVMRFGTSDVLVGIGSEAANPSAVFDVFPPAVTKGAEWQDVALGRGSNALTLSASITNQRSVWVRGNTLAGSVAVTVTNAASLYILDAATVGANMTITNNYALWVDAGTSRFDGAVRLQTQLLGDTGNIGISVVSTAFITGSLGTLIIPVRTGAGEATDAQIGNIAGALYVSTEAGNLHLGVRAGTVDNPLTVGIAGYIIQSCVPAIPRQDSWYHPQQYWPDHTCKGYDEYVDETICPVCAKDIEPGDKNTVRAVVMYPNSYISRGGDHAHRPNVHAIFGHNHIEREPEFVALTQRIWELERTIQDLRASSRG